MIGWILSHDSITIKCHVGNNGTNINSNEHYINMVFFEAERPKLIDLYCTLHENRSL